MTTRRQDETPPATAPAPKKGTTTDGVKAGQIWEKLQALDAEEAAELANAPQSIRARYEAKRTKALEGVPDGVRRLVERMRG